MATVEPTQRIPLTGNEFANSSRSATNHPLALSNTRIVNAIVPVRNENLRSYMENGDEGESQFVATYSLFPKNQHRPNSDDSESSESRPEPTDSEESRPDEEIVSIDVLA